MPVLVPTEAGRIMKAPIDVVLDRFAYSDEMGVFGTMVVRGTRLYTVENPWINNEMGISCIPVGVYRCKPRMYFKGGYNAIEITNVSGRTHILFHIANTHKDVRGCIGVGLTLGFVDGAWAVTSSGSAFKHLMKYFGNKEFVLEIKNSDAVSL